MNWDAMDNRQRCLAIEGLERIASATYRQHAEQLTRFLHDHGVPYAAIIDIKLLIDADAQDPRLSR